MEPCNRRWRRGHGRYRQSGHQFVLRTPDQHFELGEEAQPGGQLLPRQRESTPAVPGAIARRLKVAQQDYEARYGKASR